MERHIYRYQFAETVSIEEIESTLLLAVMGCESLHGQSQVRLDAAHYLDAEARACVIDASTDVGRDLARLFAGFLLREFGDDSFKVERPETPDLVHAQGCT